MRTATQRASRFVLAILSVLAFTPGAFAAEHDFVAIHLSGNDSAVATALNNRGSVVGCFNYSEGFLWRDFVLTRLGPGCPRAINDRGDIAIETLAKEVQVRWADGSTTNLGPGEIQAINNAGVVVGALSGHAFRYAQGQITMLPEYGSATGSIAVDINNAGQILLQAGDRVFIYDEATGAGTEIPRYDPAVPLRGRAINDRGQVLGNAQYTTVWRYPDGMPTQAETRNPGYGRSAGVLNNRGDFTINEEIGSLLVLQGADWRRSLRFGGIESWGEYTKEVWDMNDRGWLAGSFHHQNVAMLFVPRWDVALPLSPAIQGRKARNIDAKAGLDLLWWRPTPRYGEAHSGGFWLMNGLDIASIGVFPASAAYAELVGVTRDRSGGGLFLQRDWLSDFAFRATRFEGDGSAATTVLAESGEHRWLAGWGDFNGDGEDDLLWWLPGGQYEVWLMSGATAKARGILASPPDSRHAIIADLNGDGREDIVWLAGDGHYELTLMNGLAGTPAGTIRAAGTGFLPLAVGDFNGDGKADIVWKHPDGRQSLWLMDGASTIDSTALMDAGTGWTVSHVADMNGDGKSDLVWENKDGTQAGWLMDGTRAVDWRYFMGAGTGWRIEATADLDGNGTADFVWKHTDGSHAGWLMRGLDAFDYRYFFQGNTGWSVEP